MKQSEDHPLLRDLPRGVEGRLRIRNWMPKTFFESPERVAEQAFEDRSNQLFLGLVEADAAQFERPDGRMEVRCHEGKGIGINDDQHFCTIAGTRSGKGRGVIIPNLLTYGGSCFVVDCKGENADISAVWRAEGMGQKVLVLDPFSITSSRLAPYRCSFNALHGLNLGNPTLIEDAGLVADALVVSESKDPHWSESARDFIEGVILHVVTFHEFASDERNLVTVADLIFGRRMGIEDLLEEMALNDSLDGLIVGVARCMQEKPKDERGSVLSTARRNLRFLLYPSIRSVSARHDFDLEDLKRNEVTLYMCLPALRMASCARWLRLFVNLTLCAMEKVSAKPPIPLLMALDEFPVLGYMKELETAAGQIAGLGVRMWTVIQDLGQLKSLYKERWETFLGNSTLQFFGNSEVTTLEWVSKRLGQTSIDVLTHGSLSHDQRNRTGASGQGQQQQTVALLTGEEVSRYFGRNDHLNRQLIIRPGERPMILQRAWYDCHELFAGRFQTWEGKK